MYLAYLFFAHPCRLRLSGKKKKKITLHMKRPGAKKDEMKLVLLKLKSIIQSEQTDSCPLPSRRGEDSESDKDS
jgi:hypothetical protein